MDAAMQNEDEVRRRIALLRFLMIFGVVLLHTPPYVPIKEVGTGAFDLFKAFFQNAVFRTTVPVLTAISGYLLFRSMLDRQPGKLALKKFCTIVVPFLFFNLLLLGAVDFLENGLHVRLGEDMVPDDPRGWANAAFGLFDSPINYPLNFLRDLVVLMLLAPLFGWMLRHIPWLGLGAVLLVFMNNLDGHFLLRDVMAPVFYLGGLAAVRRRGRDQHRPRRRHRRQRQRDRQARQQQAHEGQPHGHRAAPSRKRRRSRCNAASAWTDDSSAKSGMTSQNHSLDIPSVSVRSW